MSRIRIDLFGPPRIEVGTERHSHSSRKTMALLAYLAARGGEPIGRAHLGGLLWGDSPEDQARTNLRQALSQLRKLFREAGLDPIEATKEEITLIPDGIEILTRRAVEAMGPEEILRVADGPGFLEGFGLSARGFDDWMQGERRLLEERLCRRLEDLADQREAEGDFTGASAAVARALRLDALNEGLHRRQMRLLSALGRADAALAQFETCRQVLQHQLDVAPEPETRDLAARIRAERGRRAGGTAPGDSVLYCARATGGAPEKNAVFGDAEEAVDKARALAGTAAVAVVEASGDDARDRSRAAQMLADLPGGGVVADASTAAKFDHTSRYAFTERAGPSGEPPLFRVTPMVRNRYQFAPTRDVPPVRPETSHSLVVLPFRDFSPTANEAYLGLMLSEEITARLARYGHIKVMSPSAAQTCRKFDLDSDQIRTRLGVSYLVDGSVFHMGDNLRVNMTVTNLRDGSVVVSDSFDGAFSQLFEKQSDLVDRISFAVAKQTGNQEMARAERALTGDMGSFEWYLRGMAHHRRAGLSLNHARQAFDDFNNAVSLDPEFARAYAWRMCAVSWYDTGYTDDGRAQADVDRALALDERDPEVNRVAASLAIMRGDHDAGIHHLAQTVEMNPSDAYMLAYFAANWAWAGAPEKGLKHMERALALDPFMPAWAVEDSVILRYSMGEYRKAVAEADRLLLAPPRSLAFKAASQMALDDVDAARQSVARIFEIDPDYTADHLRMVTFYRDPAQTSALFGRLENAGLR